MAHGRYGDSALKKAIFNGHYEVVFRLIEMGADVNVCDHTGKTPLHFAAEKVRKRSKDLGDGRRRNGWKARRREEGGGRRENE